MKTFSMPKRFLEDPARRLPGRGAEKGADKGVLLKFEQTGRLS